MKPVIWYNIHRRFTMSKFFISDTKNVEEAVDNFLDELKAGEMVHSCTAKRAKKDYLNRSTVHPEEAQGYIEMALMKRRHLKNMRKNVAAIREAENLK